MTFSGVDTLSLAFRPSNQRWIDRALQCPHQVTGHGGLIFRQPGPGKTKLGAYGMGDLFYVEGRMDALMQDNAESWNLRPASDAVRAEMVARAALAQLADGEGIPADVAEVRRFDLAHEFEFTDPGDGLAFLRANAGMCPPRRKITTWKSADGQLETVYVRQAKSRVVTERIYDKGVESASHSPGLRIRYEAQRRPPKAKRMSTHAFASVDLAGEYGRSISSYMEGEETVIAAGSEATIEHLAGAAARGELSMAKAERMIGTVALLRQYGRAVYPDVQQQQRRLRGLREAGVALDHELPPERTVPVGKLLRDSMEAFRA